MICNSSPQLASLFLYPSHHHGCVLNFTPLPHPFFSFQCQGMSLDLAEMSLKECFEYGQIYVAISRMRTLEGLRITSFDSTKCVANPKVLEYYKREFNASVPFTPSTHAPLIFSNTHKRDYASIPVPTPSLTPSFTPSFTSALSYNSNISSFASAPSPQLSYTSTPSAFPSSTNSSTPPASKFSSVIPTDPQPVTFSSYQRTNSGSGGSSTSMASSSSSLSQQQQLLKQQQQMDDDAHFQLSQPTPDSHPELFDQINQRRLQAMEKLAMRKRAKLEEAQVAEEE